MMMLRKMPAMLFVGALALATGCGGGDDGDETGGDRTATIMGLEGDAASGQTLFSTGSCGNMACHGMDGVSGTVTPALNVSVPMADETQIINTFLNGKGSMPPQSNLSDQDLADLATYVIETFG